MHCIQFCECWSNITLILVTDEMFVNQELSKLIVVTLFKRPGNAKRIWPTFWILSRSYLPHSLQVYV